MDELKYKLYSNYIILGFQKVFPLYKKDFKYVFDRENFIEFTNEISNLLKYNTYRKRLTLEELDSVKLSADKYSLSFFKNKLNGSLSMTMNAQTSKCIEELYEKYKVSLLEIEKQIVQLTSIGCNVNTRLQLLVSINRLRQVKGIERYLRKFFRITTKVLKPRDIKEIQKAYSSYVILNELLNKPNLPLVST